MNDLVNGPASAGSNGSAPEGSGRRTIGIYGYCASADDTFGGVESQIHHLARALAAGGWRVVVHCLSAPLAGWHVTGGEFHIGPHGREVTRGVVEFVPGHGPGLEGAVAENVAASRRYGEELVLVFGTRDGWVFDTAFAAADQLGLPVVSCVYFTAEERWYRGQFTSRTRSIAGLADQSERAGLDGGGRRVLARVLEGSQLVVVPTDYVRGQLSALTDPANAAKVAVVYHGVDTDLFTRRADPWVPGERWLHVSRVAVPFAGHKNLAWSCEFLRIAAGLEPAPGLWVCGSGNAEGLVRAFGRQNGMEDRITVTGFVEQARLAGLMREATVLLVPSMMEAGCTVIVEAVLSGCLPVVVDFAGAGEMMRALGLGEFLVPPVARDLGSGVPTVIPDTARALEVVAAAYRDPEPVHVALAHAAEIATERFSLAATTRELTERLAGLVTQPPAPAQVVQA